MSSDTARIAPLDAPHAPEVAAELARWMPPGAAIEPLALFRTLARHLPLAEAMRSLGSYFLSKRARLDRRTREIVIDRVCARAGCVYEWGVHVTAFGAAAGLTDAQTRATALGAADDPAWAPDEALVVRLVDELHDTAQVSDALWHALAARWSVEELLELLVLPGWYRAIIHVANGVRVAPEAWAAAFPTPD